MVVEENVENLEDDSKKEGFAAVAGSAVSLRVNILVLKVLERR